MIRSKETPERGTFLGLVRNPAFLTATLGMAAMTFSLGGIQVWMPQFLYSERHYSLAQANFIFGIIIVVDGIVAALAGGWLGDYLLRRMKSAYYLVSAVSMALGVPVMIVALFAKGRAMVPAIALAAFFLLLNTSPLNAAVINSVGAHIRATAIAVNIFIIHILGDVPSPTMMGWVADRRSLQSAFILPVIAMAISSAILFYGMRFAPPLRVRAKHAASQASLRSIFLSRCIGKLIHWIAGGILALAWFSRIVEAAFGMPRIADIARPEWDRRPATPNGEPESALLFRRATRKNIFARRSCSCSPWTIPTTKLLPSTTARPTAPARSWMRLLLVARRTAG